MGLSFTYFNTVQTPTWAGIQNYISLMTKDPIFMQKILPNTIKSVSYTHLQMDGKTHRVYAMICILL